MNHKLSSTPGPGTVLEVTPEIAGWQVLDFSIVSLAAGQTWVTNTRDREVAIVPQEGKFEASTGAETFTMQRTGVFEEMAPVLYLPPDTPVQIDAIGPAELAVGGAPADGKYPVRLIQPHEMKVEVRGGGGATRQVNHILAHPLPAERLILYEVYVPRGKWSGWPPHCHDGYEGSPYLEETYYFRFDPPNGWGVHRNYRLDSDFDETFSVVDRDVVMVTQGFHSSAAAPGNHMYFLNYLAGELLDDDRGTPPYDDPKYVHLKADWTGTTIKLPVFGQE